MLINPFGSGHGHSSDDMSCVHTPILSVEMRTYRLNVSWAITVTQRNTLMGRFVFRQQYGGPNGNEWPVIKLNYVDKALNTVSQL